MLEDGNCSILHHKVIVIDERTVITGSYNFTNSAEQDNDGNLVIVDDPALARAYLDEFARVCAGASADALSLGDSLPPNAVALLARTCILQCGLPINS